MYQFFSYLVGLLRHATLTKVRLEIDLHMLP
jgi:hypothetical protein